MLVFDFRYWLFILVMTVFYFSLKSGRWLGLAVLKFTYRLIFSFSHLSYRLRLHHSAPPNHHLLLPTSIIFPASFLDSLGLAWAWFQNSTAEHCVQVLGFLRETAIRCLVRKDNSTCVELWQMIWYIYAWTIGQDTGILVIKMESKFCLDISYLLAWGSIVNLLCMYIYILCPAYLDGEIMWNFFYTTCLPKTGWIGPPPWTKM